MKSHYLRFISYSFVLHCMLNNQSVIFKFRDRYTPSVSIITEFSSNKIVTSPITKTLFRDSYAFQILDAKDIMLALEVNRSDKDIMETKVWQSSDFHKIALILKNANIDIILVPGKKGKSWTLFYLANKSLRKMDVAQLKKPNPNEREFRSALSKTLGYQALSLEAKTVLWRL